ncbi:hypothetical protein [Actinoplanes sp. RD1]|uniref:hypothetical protein n=1 Tax=Actinoplanes sp. RD1 TaxID=3064538 RepID=UPI00274128D4|nr:hypothetical protein [Actinoplanes sp. RD1]
MSLELGAAFRAAAIAGKHPRMSEDDNEVPGDAALEYSRRLYSNVVDWYQVAETKAQVILSPAGIFTSFLTGSVLVKSSDTRETVQAFAWHTWCALALLAVALAASITSAVMCLVTRIMPRREAERRYAGAGAGTGERDRGHSCPSC